MSSRTVPRLMWVTDRARQTLPTRDIAVAVVGAGVEAIHIREKDMPEAELRELIEDVIEEIEGRATVIVNSDATLARDFGVGLHLPESVPFKDVDSRPYSIVGRSVHSARSAETSAGFDYVIAGHVFETGSKQGRTPLGVDGLRAIVQRAPVPALAIGGITPGNVADVLATGAYGVAVMSGIGSAPNPGLAARAYRLAIDDYARSSEMKRNR